MDKRIEYIDVFRGIGIALMVLGHMKFEFRQESVFDSLFSSYDHIIHSFHMPMFFFISGFCYRQKDIQISKRIAKLGRKLLIPYVVFGTSQYLLWRIFEGDSIAPLIHLYSVNTEGLAIAGALWFLTALLISNVLYIIIDKYITRFFVMNLVVMIISLAGCLLPQLFSFRLPFAIDAAMAGVGFFHVGRIINENKESKVFNRLLNLNLGLCVISAIAVGLIIYSSDKINMRTGRYGNIIMFYINAICAILILISFSKVIGRSSILPINWIKSELCVIGRTGIVYVCINQLIITVTATIMARIGISNNLYNFLIVIIVFALLRLSGYVIMNTKLRILAGKG